jgi:hypothetical protein
MLLLSRFSTIDLPCPHESPMNNPDPKNQSLACLLEAVSADPALSAPQRRDRASAIRTLAKALAMRPEDIPLNVKLIRRRMDEVEPVAVGISPARWKNVRALVARALEGKTRVSTGAQS